MRYRWITDLDEFKKISKEWDDLLISSGEDNPFLLSDFLLTWWNHYSTGLALRIFTVFENGRLIGGLPLYETVKRRIGYIGGWAANYTQFLSKGREEDKLSIWRIFLQALREKKNWRSACLKRYINSNGDMDKFSSGLMGVEKELLLDYYKSGQTYLIDIPQDFSMYFEALPKKLRYYLRRSEKGFSRLGRVRLFSAQDPEHIGMLADKYIKFSRDSFRARGMRSVFENTRYVMFFKEAITKFCGIKYLDANALMLNEKVVAIHFGYSLGNNLNYVFTAFDNEFSEFSPGHLLIYKLIELGSKRKNRLFDFYSGWNLYKEQWCDRKKDIVTIEIRPRCLRSRIEAFISARILKSRYLSKIKKIAKRWRAETLY